MFNWLTKPTFYRGWIKRNPKPVTEAMLTGLGIPHLRLGRFIFMKNTITNYKILNDKGFDWLANFVTDFVTLKGLTITTEGFNSESVMYNPRFNIAINMIPPKFWKSISLAINIADDIKHGNRLEVLSASYDNLIQRDELLVEEEK